MDLGHAAFWDILKLCGSAHKMLVADGDSGAENGLLGLPILMFTLLL